MRVVYVALKPLVVGADLREPGDLVPEAHSWNFLPGYVAEGKLFPVLVATLPEDAQMMLLEWEEAQSGTTAVKTTTKQKASA